MAKNNSALKQLYFGMGIYRVGGRTILNVVWERNRDREYKEFIKKHG